jgi:hypothetical protein
MGTWSASLFGDDLACDVRDGWLDLLRQGLDGKQATRKLSQEMAEEIADEGDTVWLALAATQWKYGRLEPRVKARALKIIDSGRDLEARQHADARFLKQRRRLLEQLRQQLASPPPPERKVRVQKPLQPSQRGESKWQLGQVVAYRRTRGTWALFLTEYVERDRKHGLIPYLAVLNWQGEKLPPPSKIKRLSVLPPGFGRVVKLYPDRGRSPPWDRLELLTEFRELSGLIWFEGKMVLGGRTVLNWSELDEFLDEKFPDQRSRAPRRP